MHWSARYIGINHSETAEPSFAAASCWGLICLVYRDELGIQLPTYAGAFTSLDEVDEVEQLFASERLSRRWMVAEGCLPFDVALFRTGLHRRHVGLVVKPGIMLHVAADQPARLEAYDAPHWRPRLLATFRHVETPLQVALRAVA